MNKRQISIAKAHKQEAINNGSLAMKNYSLQMAYDDYLNSDK